MTDATRDLIQRLADELYNYECLTSRRPPDYIPAPSPLIDEARAYLAQPDPEEPTDEEIADEARKYLVNEYALPADITFLLNPDNFQYKPTIGCFRAVIAADRARCGRPAVEPPIKPAHHTTQHCTAGS